MQQSDSNSFIEISNNGESFVIKGNSFTPDPRVFYSNVLSWARDFKLPAGKQMKIDATPGYYSTSNIQVFNLIFKTLAGNNPGTIDITFHVDEEEEEDMEETIYSLTFNTGLAPVIRHISEPGA